MDVFQLTRALVDIESTSGNESAVGDFLFAHLSALALNTGGTVEQMAVPGHAPNILATWDQPRVTLSTHMDTVPPYFSSREDNGHIWGRGACDAKGIIAAMIDAAENLLAGEIRNFALLFVVGEEKGSQGAKAAALAPRGSKFLINGEPTENKLALGSKGALRFELTARGKLAHSAYPDLGDSAIEKLLDVLEAVRGIALPEDPVLGKETLNIGTISGGHAPNVIADSARAEIMFRTVFDAQPLRDAVLAAADGRVEVREQLYTPVVRMPEFDGLPTTTVSFTTDIPSFANAWGRPFLIGPGSIHVAHTAEEKISKKELAEAVAIYARMTKKLIATGIEA